MRRIAGWNSARDVWETDQVDVISQRSDVYSETFPISGMTVNGVAYELPTSGHHMDASGSLFSQLGGKILPPPAASVANDGEGPETWLARREAVKAKGINGNGMGMPLTIAVQLLPTPSAADGNGGGRGNSPGHQDTLPGTVREIAAGALLPTPKAGDADFGMPRTSGRPPEKSTHLMTRLAHTSPNAMLPTPRATRGGSNTEIAYSFGGQRSDNYREQGSVELPEGAEWGPYAAAIERWESVLGRPAPDPTEVGPKGGRRLSAGFVEWMMGLPESWVTDPVLGLSRTQQLKMLGNGVVTQQAVAAHKSMGAHASGEAL